MSKRRTPRTIAEAIDSAEIIEFPKQGGRGPFDVDAMNREFAFIYMGANGMVLEESPNAPLEEQIRFRKVSAFRDRWRTHVSRVMVEGKAKSVSWADLWLNSPDRRTYQGLEFHPDPHSVEGTPRFYNLWRGFSVEPLRGGSYSIFRDHLRTNICNGDEALFKYVFAFFADLVQRPREKPGIALVLRGGMGTGKTIVGEIIGSLIDKHYYLVDDPRYVTGQFNMHMASCLLLQADEAVWAGDKAAEGRLKGLITSNFQQIEAKGVDPIRLPNYLRLIMTSNESWVIPAGMDERRFVVLDVAPHCAGQHTYFREMREELDAGGREALLADLLAFDLSTVNLREIPRTGGLLEQKVMSLTHGQAWWHERLMEGTVTRKHTAWERTVIRSDLYDDYVLTTERVGVRRRSTEVELGLTLAKLVPDLQETRPWLTDEDGNSRRRRCYVLPSLRECREHFERLVQQPVVWPDTEP